LKAERRKVSVPDEEVDKALEHKRLMHTEFKPIELRDKVEATDVVIVALKGTVGEHPVDRPEMQIDLSDPGHEPLPGLTQALIGMPLGSKDVDVKLDIPDTHEQKEIAGKTAQLKVTLRDAREKVVPTLDDEFAKDTGEADTLAELRQKVRESLEKRAREGIDREVREALLKELVKENPVPIAPALVERGIDSQIQRARLSFAMQGVDLDKTGVDLTAMRAKLRDGASEEVRGQLLLEALADREKIEVTETDVDAKVAEVAAAQNKRAAKVKADMDKEGTLDTLRWRIRQEKALDLVVSRATIVEVDPPPPAPPAESEAAKGDAP
jgi:trigger factor